MNCDWCDKPTREVVPVMMRRHLMIDAAPGGDEKQYGNSCPDCIESKRFQSPPKFWLAEEQAREDRANLWPAPLPERLGK